MQSFTFRFYGINYNTRAEHYLLAMSDANDYFRPFGGAWFDAGHNCYVWKTGNFFD